ncbi:unnamed protein product [Mytilus edulis]|uniref:B box-type domain-containing protein n=1 Tax=Mytilus edulis TaxID=6550 RepID=A0A8S3R2W2_MYTED|nr:unnamed protein product [Mytilus edulis]
MTHLKYIIQTQLSFASSPWTKVLSDDVPSDDYAQGVQSKSRDGYTHTGSNSRADRLKVQTSITHDIVDVKSSEAKTEMEHTIITDNIPCQIHKKKLNCMFCRTCDNLVCPDCITASHKRHDLDSIDTVCNEKREKLKEIESKFSEKFTLCEIEDNRVRDFKTKYEQLSAESVQKINQQEQLIKDEVTKGKHTEEVKETLLYKQSNIQEVLESKQAAQVFSAYSDFSEKEILNVSFKGISEETKDFIPTKDSINTISNFFGSLHITKLPKGLPRVNLDVIKSYNTDLHIVFKILTLNDKTAWIIDKKFDILRKININDTIHNIEDNPVKGCYDMSLTDHDDVLLTSVGSTDVSLLKTEVGEIKPFLSVSPPKALGIHVTKHNEIILGVKENDVDNYNQTEKTCRKVIMFGMDGTQKQCYEYDKHKQRLFTLPVRITSNVSNDILVIDRISNAEGG